MMKNTACFNLSCKYTTFLYKSNQKSSPVSAIDIIIEQLAYSTKVFHINIHLYPCLSSVVCISDHIICENECTIFGSL